MNYLNVTYEQLLQDFKARLNSDPKFKNIGSATIYGMFMEMIAAVADMTNFYVQRTAEESFISTARLDSSVIKHGKGLGYNPRRPIPARCNLKIRLRGPLPSTVKAGTEVFFSQENTDLVYNGYKFILDSGYSYRFTGEDIANGQSSDWTKDLYFSVPKEKATYLPLTGLSIYSTTHTIPIACFQGERKIQEILATANIDKIGEANQFYDIDDLEFSNWYGERDPFAFRNNVYEKTSSWCKVGVGADDVDAFNEENLFDVECQSIYLNKNLVNTKPDDQIDKKFKICLIDTNSDKTVRVSFASEPNICDIGLKSLKDNIYVKYIATKGKEANRTGVKGSVMTHNNNIKVNIEGSFVDITNNVQFIIDSDIYGGEDFESQASIKINAPAYFSSCGKLITKDDFTSYFRALTSPITVQNALVFGQQEIEGLGEILHKLIQNNVFYCIMGHLYRKNDGNWTPRNVLTDYDTNTDAFTIYGDKYLEHLCDYIKMLYSYNGYFNKIFKGEAEEQWLKNVRLIYENCKHKMEINSILMPLPPVVQYYDIVGTVEVDRTVDLESYTTEMKNTIYEYLDTKAAKDRSVYKSEIINLYNKNEHTKAVNIDIRISDIVQSSTLNYDWSSNGNSDFKLYRNYNLDSYTKAMATVDNNTTKFEEKYGKGWWNELVISNIDQNGKPITKNTFNNKFIVLEIQYLDSDGTNLTNSKLYRTNRVKFNCIENPDDNTLTLQPQSVQGEGDTVNYRDYLGRPSGYITPIDIYATEDGVISLTLKIPTTFDFYSTSNFDESRILDYKITQEDFNKLNDFIDNWLNHLSTIKEVNRPIPLPYEVTSNTTDTRNESIIRRGNIIGNNSVTLSEFTFWNYLVPYILNTYYSDTAGTGITDTTEYDSEIWTAASALIMDIYALIKPGICDSILDENNNITNYSTDMELPILINKVTVIPQL